MADTQAVHREAQEERGGLKRAVTPAMLLLFVVGDMVGGGIYALVGEVGGRVGGALWSGFALALLLALFTAGSYAELVTKYPKAGGAALYVHRAFGVPVRDVPARLRGDDVLDHVGGRALARVRRRLPERVRRPADVILAGLGDRRR